MKIAIVGTRGIPNNYGGFEQFAEFISVGLVAKGHEVTVISPHFHPYKLTNFKGVKIKHIYSPEKLLKSAANFIYDWLALKYAINKKYDIIYEAGYQSSAISVWRFHKKKYSIIITNMDGLEWKRSKWNYFTQKLTLLFERLATNYSHYLVADNIGIQTYLQERYNKKSFCIAYGADLVEEFDESVLQKFNVNKKGYFILVARIEPENNIETILDGYLLSKSDFPFIVIGNINTLYGKVLMKKYEAKTSIRFLGGIYDKNLLDNLRHFSRIYFHGHSVGGTNPSLLEAMASKTFICAHNNIFNKSVLEGNSLYFTDAQSIKMEIDNYSKNETNIEKLIRHNALKIMEKYSWKRIVEEYEELFNLLLIKQS